MAGGLTRDERPALDRALRGDLRRTAGHRARPGDPRPDARRPSPTSSSGSPSTPTGPPLAHRLERWATGSLAAPVRRRHGAARSTGGCSSSASPRSPTPRCARSPSSPRSGVLWDAVRRDLAPKLVVVDEAWKVMRQPSGAEFVEELARSARHYHAGLQLATQDIVEFLRSRLRRVDRQAVRHAGPARPDARGRRRARPLLRPDARRAPLARPRPTRARGSCSSGAATSPSRPGQPARVRDAHHPSSRPARPVPGRGTTLPNSAVRRPRVRLGAALGCAVRPRLPRSSSGRCASGSSPATGRRSRRPRSRPPRRPSPTSRPTYLALYQDAAARFGLDWEVLAAVGRVETNHGRNRNGCAPNYAGARARCSSCPRPSSTPRSSPGIADPDICDPVDAIPAAAAYLQVQRRARSDWEHALYRYNPADWYPPLVMGWAVRYGYGASVVWPIEGRITPALRPDDVHRRAAALLRGHVLRALPRRARHRGAGRHAGPGDGGGAGDPRRPRGRRRGRGR